MKTTIIIIALIFSAVLSAPAMAFDPPTQGTDNATDVVLWPGDNITIESANITGTVTVDGSLDIDDLSTISDDWLAFIIAAFLIVVVLVAKSTVLYAVGFIASFVYGLGLAADEDVYSTLWISGVCIALLGIWFLFKVALSAWEFVREKRR